MLQPSTQFPLLVFTPKHKTQWRGAHCQREVVWLYNTGAGWHATLRTGTTKNGGEELKKKFLLPIKRSICAT